MRYGYKMTEIGEIPEDWQVKKLGDLVEFKGRIGWKGYKKSDIRNCGVLVIGGTQVSKNNKIDLRKATYLSDEKYYESPEIMLEDLDIILVKTGNTIGKLALVHNLGKATINPNTVILRSKEKKLDVVYLYQLMTTSNFYKILWNLVVVGAQPSVNQLQLKSITIALPTSEEQKKIAEILSTVDEKIDVVEQHILKTQELKKGLMQQLLTKGIGHTEFKDSPLGELPVSWKVKQLKDLGNFYKGKGILKSELISTGLPCIRYGEIYTVHNYVIKQFYSFIDQQVAEQSQPINKGDILFAGSGETVEEIGKCVAFIGEEEAYAGGDVIAFTPSNMDSLYLAYCLNSNIIIEQRRKYGQGNAVVHIYSRDLAKLNIPVPPIAEQQKIGEIFYMLDEKLIHFKTKKKKGIELKKGLMQQLLTGKMRVNHLIENELFA